MLDAVMVRFAGLALGPGSRGVYPGRAKRGPGARARCTRPGHVRDFETTPTTVPGSRVPAKRSSMHTSPR